MTQESTPTAPASAQHYIKGDFFAITKEVFVNIKESVQALMINPINFVVFIALPMSALLIVGGAGLASLLFFMDDSGVSENPAYGTIALGLLATLLVFLVIAPAFLLTQLESVQGRRISLSDSFDRGLKFLPQLIVLGILSTIAILIGLIFLIIPGILIAFFLSFAPYILIDKKVSAVQAMKMSYRQVQKYWKPVVAYLLVQLAIQIVASVPIINIFTIFISIAYMCLLPYIYAVSEDKKVVEA